VNPSTAFAVTLADELIRCGMADAVLAPGSRSAPLALALADRARRGDVRLHVRIDERSAAYLALGLAKADGRPAGVICTSGTAAASFHPAVMEADESCVPLLVLTADRPPELRGTGANQAVDQIKLYGSSVRWFCEAGVPEEQPGMVAYWRSLACRAWAHAAGAAGGRPGPVHLNLPLREPLVPDLPPSADTGTAAGAVTAGSGAADEWPEPLEGRPGGRPWTSFGGAPEGRAAWAAGPGHGSARGQFAPLDLPWTERGVIVCGDGGYDAGPLLDLAETAGWPVLAEPSSGARRGPNALSAYQYLLGSPEFMASHRPDVIVSAGRPGLSRAQMAFLRAAAGISPGDASTGAGAAPPARHVVIAQHADQWADPARSATDVVPAVRLTAPHGGHGGPAGNGSRRTVVTAWLESWQSADTAARRAADEILDADDTLSEPRLARDLAAALPDGALLWAASSLPVRDLDSHMAPRGGLRVLASRGASGIDGTASAAIGAALAHQAAGGGPSFALIGDLAFLHDAPGLILGPGEPRPDLCLVVVNNDGGGIFSMLEQAAFAGPSGPFERVFGTPHGADLRHLAAAARLPYTSLERPGDLAAVMSGPGLRVAEVRTSRAAGAALRARLQEACGGAAAAAPFWQPAGRSGR
jgi:2-succinyl-5-enolpyruvyl-6-hydroxy-3-cyclohexene-1-carboxylate synthase